MDGDSNNHAHEVEREKFAVAIKCPGCGQIGSSAWEENARLHPKGPMPELLSVSAGFYLRVRKNLLGLPQIVCDHCDTPLKD